MEHMCKECAKKIKPEQKGWNGWWPQLVGMQCVGLGHCNVDAIGTHDARKFLNDTCVHIKEQKAFLD